MEVVMECINCKNDNALTVLIETFPCRHCDGEINMEYNVCKECGFAWKTMDGELFSGTAFFDASLGNFFGDEEEIEKLFNTIVGENESGVCMQDSIHKCLKCDSVAYKVDEALYRCSKCDFEWEIIRSG
jgi:ribosomal protein L37E